MKDWRAVSLVLAGVGAAIFYSDFLLDVGTVVFGYYGAADSSSWQTGIAQRCQIGMTSAWIICLAVFAAMAGLRPASKGAKPATSPDDST